MPIDPDALMKLVQAAERAGVVEQAGKIVGDVMMKVANEPNLDYEKFFGVIAKRLNFDTMSKGMGLMSSLTNLMNPVMRLVANDFVMMMVAIPLSIPFVQKIGVAVASKVAIFMLKGKRPKMIPSFKKA